MPFSHSCKAHTTQNPLSASQPLTNLVLDKPQQRSPAWKQSSCAAKGCCFHSWECNWTEVGLLLPRQLMAKTSDSTNPRSTILLWDLVTEGGPTLGTKKMQCLPIQLSSAQSLTLCTVRDTPQEEDEPVGRLEQKF